MDLSGLVKELERQKENSLDLIVESSTLKAIPDEQVRVEKFANQILESPLKDFETLEV